VQWYITIINPILKKRIQYLKEEEGGYRSMCKLMEDLIDDVVRDDRIDIAKAFIALGKLSLEDISRASKLPLSTVEELASSMEKKDPA